MTLSDSRAMKIPPPIVKDPSCILVSKKRLIALLGHLGFIDDTADGQNLVSMIHMLWQEAFEYTNGSMELMTAGSNDSDYNAIGKGNDSMGNATMEGDETDNPADLIQLGTLKWILYGFPAKQPSWFSSFCMPCTMTSAEKALHARQGVEAQEEHPVRTSMMKRRHGELVRHDVITCKLCRNATGCEHVSEDNDERRADEVMPLPISSQRTGSTSLSAREGSTLKAGDDISIVDSTCESVVEVSTIASLMAGDMHMLEATEEKVRI